MFGGDLKPRLIHRPRCVPGKRDPLCHCQTMKQRAESVEDDTWETMDFPSPEAYAAWIKRTSGRDSLLFTTAKLASKGVP